MRVCATLKNQRATYQQSPTLLVKALGSAWPHHLQAACAIGRRGSSAFLIVMRPTFTTPIPSRA